MLLLLDNSIKKIEVHYFFDDQSHTMDAVIRNRCEHELLLILNEVASLLDTELRIDTEALLEGGLKERLILITKNKFLQGILAGILISLISQYLTTDRELRKLEKEELKLNIEKLKEDLEKDENISNFNLDKAIYFFQNNYKIVKHRSNYYRQLYNYRKVTKISTTLIDETNHPTEFKSTIERSEFDRFILEYDELPSEIDEDATIEIISPVLIVGRYKWKGIYSKTGEIIDFSMKDKQFKDEVIKNGVPFKNGTCIDCLLEISRKLDEVGDIKKTGYYVLIVTHIHDEKSIIETPQGKKYRDKKEADISQLRLNIDNDYEK